MKYSTSDSIWYSWDTAEYALAFHLSDWLYSVIHVIKYSIMVIIILFYLIQTKLVNVLTCLS